VLNRLRLWIRSVALRRRLEREMQDEMAEHLERSTARLMARGLSEKEARREAIREFGNVTYLQEEARYARGWGLVDTLEGDARFAVRQYRRKPGTTVTMLAVLMVGVSIATALFSVLHSLSSQPPAGVARDADLVRIRGSQTLLGERVARRFSYEELQEYRRLTTHFRELIGWSDDAVTIDAGAEEDRRSLPALATFVTEDYFRVLGVRPVVGAGLPGPGTGETGARQAAVIGYATWQLLFGGSPDAVGATLQVNGVPVTVVGVAPNRFMARDGADQFRLWLPLPDRRVILPDAHPEAEVFSAAARLRDGMSLRAATAAVRVIAGRAVPTSPAGSAVRTPGSDVVPLLALNDDPGFEGDMRLEIMMFGGLGVLVLLVTCTNVSALLTGVAMARRREIAIRLSIGAARTRIVRQLLTESVLLAAVAGAGALWIVWVFQRVATTALSDIPVDLEVRWQTVAFTLGVILAVGVLFGLSPALHATRMTVGSALKDSSATMATSRGGLQRGLVVAQIALAQPLVVGVVALLVITLGEYRSDRPNEAGDHIVSLGLRSRTAMTGVQVQDTQSLRQLRTDLERLIDRLEGTPGVAAAVPNLPMNTALDGYSVHPADRVQGGFEEPLRMYGPTAASGYFGVLGIPIVMGREFIPSDPGPGPGPGPEAAAAEIPIIINAEFARKVWPGANPLGRRLVAPSDSVRSAHTLTVVGVVDEPAEGGATGERHRVYLPLDDDRLGLSPGMLIRTTRPARALIPEIRRVVREEVPGTAVTEASTIADLEAESRYELYTAFALLGGSGLLTLLLSAIGLYAVIAFAVGQRTREIAIRMAVGARARRIIGVFLGDGLRLSMIGMLIGMPLSLAGLRFILAAEDALLAVSLPSVAAMAAIGVLCVAGAATWIPAQRATRIDPAMTLRGD
jgi:predicted permease